MNIEEKTEQIKKSIERLSNELISYKTQLEFIETFKQPNTIDLYNGIEKFFDIEKSNGKYTYILGGDGRSQPWDEQRTGIIAKIKIKKGIYLSHDQEEIIKEYVENIHKPKHIELTYFNNLTT